MITDSNNLNQANLLSNFVVSGFRSCSVVSSFTVIEPGSASGSCTVVAQVGFFF